MSTSLSPPPRMASPHRNQAPLPSPPILPRRSSRNRLQLHARPEEPPIPPRLIGSPLLKKMTVRPDEPHLLTPKAHSELWIDGDEFGTRRRDNIGPGSPSPGTSPSPTRHGHRRSPSIIGTTRARSHSPPPTPLSTSPPPPVPPIPSFALATPGAKRSVVRSQPLGRTQIQIPNMSLAPPLALSPPPKRNRWARAEAYPGSPIEIIVHHSNPRPVAT